MDAKIKSKKQTPVEKIHLFLLRKQNNGSLPKPLPKEFFDDRKNRSSGT